MLRLRSIFPLLVALAGCGTNPPASVAPQNTAAVAPGKTVPGSAAAIDPLAPHPLRIVLAVDAHGDPKISAPVIDKLKNELTASLEAAGFTAAHQEGPATVAVLDKEKVLVEAAKKVGAAFIVHIDIPSIFFDRATNYTRAEGIQLELQKVGEEGALLPRPLSRGAGGATDDERLLNLGQWIAESMELRALEFLVDHPSTQSALQSKDARAAKLRTYIDKREKAIADVRRTNDEVFKKMETGADIGAKLTLHNPGDAVESLWSTGPLGALVVRTSFKYVAKPRTMQVVPTSFEYDLAWISPGGERKVVHHDVGNMQDVDTARDGNRSVFFSATTRDEASKSFVVVEPGQPPRHIMLGPLEDTSKLALAPDGKMAALIVKTCKDCQDDLLVVSVDDGSVLFRMNSKDYYRKEMVWLDARKLAVIENKANFESKTIDEYGTIETEPQKLEMVDFSSKKPKVTLLAKNDQRTYLRDIVASQDGKKLLYATKYGWYALLDVASRKATPVYPGEDPAPYVRLSPDAKSIVYNGFEGIYLFELATRQKRRLTKHTSRSLPRFSHDGTRVYISFGSDGVNSRGLMSGFVGSVAVKDAGPPEVIDLPAPEPADTE